MRLQSEVISVADLSDGEARHLFQIFSRHYEQVNWPNFMQDLRQKDFVILLRDTRTEEYCGFSTQEVFRFTVGGVSLRAIFSGDTIIDRTYWGERELVRSWCQFAGSVRATEPETRLFWFLISKGYRTYLFLPLFYREFFPRHDVETPPFEQSVIDALAERKFPKFYNRDSGLIEFPHSHGHLTSELAEIPAGRRNHPHVRFFLTRNPNYVRGTELVCLAEISPENMKSFAADCLRAGLAISRFEQRSELTNVA